MGLLGFPERGWTARGEMFEVFQAGVQSFGSLPLFPIHSSTNLLPSPKYTGSLTWLCRE